MRTVALGDIVESVGGGTPAKSRAEFYGGSIPWVTPKDMKAPEIADSQVRITDAGLASSSARLVPAGSVLVVVRSGVLKHTLPVALATAPVALNQDMRAFLPGPYIDSRYLAHLLRAKAPVVLRWVRATTADNFPFSRLLELPVPLPSLDEQRGIARILDSAESIRARRRNSRDLYVALRGALLDAILRNYDDQIRLVPLGEHAEVQGGLQVSRARERHQLRVPYLRVANVHRGMLDLSEIKLMGVTSTEVVRCALEVDDLLFVEGHGNADEIGRAARWDGSVEQCVHQNHLIRARCDPAVVVPVFAEAYVNSPAGRLTLLRAAKTTSGLNTITVNNVRSVRVRLPPITAQRAFARSAAAVDELAHGARRHLDQLDELFASLEHRAFGGAT